MKMTLIIVLLVVILGLTLLFLQGIKSRSGAPLGLPGGQLAACPGKPNCVCSEYAYPESAFIEPIAVASGAETRDWQALKAIVLKLGGKINREEENYFAATFVSRLFGFVDDVEARLDSQQGVIHLRSASRVGYSDFGVNRRRVALIKARYKDAVAGGLIQTGAAQAGDNEPKGSAKDR